MICFWFCVIETKLFVNVQVYVDGMPALSSKERKATLREFYGIFCALTSCS